MRLNKYYEEEENVSRRKNGRMWGRENSGLADNWNKKKMRKEIPNFSIRGEGRKVYIE